MTRWIPAGLMIGASLLSGCYATAPVTLTFEDFPENVAVVSLGQSITIDVTARNDDGKGVSWTCVGDACTPLASTPTSTKFTATGITGKAIITAKSLKQPSVTKSITVTVNLNEIPDLLCRLQKTNPGEASIDASPGSVPPALLI